METHSAHEHGQTPKFCLGRVVATTNALASIPDIEMANALARHTRGDWGDLEPEDLAANEQALELGGRLFSQYYSIRNTKFWVITEADRSSTTVLLPKDY